MATESRWCYFENARFPATEFELKGGGWVHVGRTPEHFANGSLVVQGRRIPGLAREAEETEEPEDGAPENG